MTDKNIDLAYRGDWCEQTAELAKAMGDMAMMEKNYRRALVDYETGGWIEQAIRVAKILGDTEKSKALEEKLR